jgi:branched-chain amino acid transport system permease protein
MTDQTRETDPRELDAAPTSTPDASARDVASSRSQPVGSIRPAPWGQRSYVTVALVLVALLLFQQHGIRLGVPGALGNVGKLSGLVTFNHWLFLAAVVTTFWMVFGVSGRFAFSTASFVGLGAYGSHYLTRDSELPVVVGVLGATAVGTVLALLFVLLLRRAQHFYFAVATLGLAQVLLLVFAQSEWLTGRSSGEISGARDLVFGEWVVDSRFRSMLVLLGFLGAVLLLGVLLRRSPVERIAIACRDNPVVASSLGYDPRRPGAVLFTVGSGLATMAGGLFIHTRAIGNTDSFGLELGIGIFVALILGGMHSLWGGLIGAGVYVYAPLYLERWEKWTQVLWGAVLVMVMILFPEGLVGLATRARTLAQRLVPTRAGRVGRGAR